MTSTTDIRNQVIEQLLAINDTDYLEALCRMIDRSHIEGPAVTLTREQKLMLTMSEADIAKGRTIEQQVLYEHETQWLKR